MKLCRACNEVRVLDAYCSRCTKQIRRDLAMIDAQAVMDQMHELGWEATDQLAAYIFYLQRDV